MTLDLDTLRHFLVQQRNNPDNNWDIPSLNVRNWKQVEIPEVTFQAISIAWNAYQDKGKQIIKTEIPSEIPSELTEDDCTDIPTVNSTDTPKPFPDKASTNGKYSRQQASMILQTALNIPVPHLTQEYYSHEELLVKAAELVKPKEYSQEQAISEIESRLGIKLEPQHRQLFAQTSYSEQQLQLVQTQVQIKIIQEKAQLGTAGLAEASGQVASNYWRQVGTNNAVNAFTQMVTAEIQTLETLLAPYLEWKSGAAKALNNSVNTNLGGNQLPLVQKTLLTAQLNSLKYLEAA